MVPLPLRTMDLKNNLQRMKCVPPVNPSSKSRQNHPLFAHRNNIAIKTRKTPNVAGTHNGSPPLHSCLQVRFHDVHHAVLTTIREEEENEEMMPHEFFTDHHNEDLPRECSQPTSHENIDRPSIQCGHIPSHNHPTVWDKLVHHLASRFGSSRYELHKGNDPTSKSTVKQKDQDKLKKMTVKREKNYTDAHKCLEDEVSPVTYEGKRFHFHGRC